MNELKINDIKELVEIPDFSIYLYIGLWVLALIVLGIFIFLIFHYFKNRSKQNRKIYYKILENIDLNNSKKAAYEITKYTRLLARSEREIKFLDELIIELEPSKYKKNADPLSNEAKILFDRFMDNIDV